MRGFKAITVVGTFYLLLITTYSSFSFIITFIYENRANEGYVGPLLLATNYSSFLIANLFAPSVRFSFKNQMKFAALAYTINYVMQTLPFQGVTEIVFFVLGSIIGGVSAALVWVVYGSYIKALCLKNQEPQLERKYFSIASSLAYASNPLGGVITTFGLGFFSDEVYFIILIVLGVLSLLFCYFFVEDVPNYDERKQPFSIKQATKIFQFYRTMAPILPMIGVDGLILAFTSTSLAKLIPETGQKHIDSLHTGICIIVFGVGTVVGGYLSGYLSDKLKIKNAGVLAIVAYLLCCGGTFITINWISLEGGIIIGFFWGVEKYFLEGWLYITAAHYYQGKLQSFAILKQFHSISFVIFQIILIINQDINLNITMGIFLFLAIPCFFGIRYLAVMSKDAEQCTSILQSQTSD